jgi:glycine dehydrogenase subunit 2
MKKDSPLIFESSREGRVAYSLKELDIPTKPLSELVSANLLRTEELDFPEVSELDLVRHFTRLSTRNHGVDSGFYPLGSCTMKYNPKINEDVANLTGFTATHPYQPEATIQGSLQLMYNLQKHLAEITGMDQVTLQPAAGAHGEWVGLMLIKAYHDSKGNHYKNKVIIPDSAHGTNPASAVIAGYEVVTVGSNAEGNVDVDALRELVGADTAALMLTNPNTLGLFEKDILEMAEIVHEAGGLLYYDGANANAIMGIVRPGDMGFDVVHLNLHKTFATPHGGGGPGAGPVGVKDFLAPFLPKPMVVKSKEKYYLDYDLPQSIGKIKQFYGNFSVLVKAYAYIRTLGASGLKQAATDAVLNANYMLKRLEQYYCLPFNRICMHEFVLSGVWQKKQGVRTLDIAKRLLDFGVHPPTVYFPLIVEECLMIEPTETESKETLDEYCDILIGIAQEAETNPEKVTSAPHTTVVGRLDEVKAARNLILRYSKQAE